MAEMKVYVVEVGVVITNCYLVLNSETHELIIIDPGDKAAEINEKIVELEGRPVAILLTHGHYDHILAVNDLKELYPGLPVYVSEQDARMLADPRLNCYCYGKRIEVVPDKIVHEGDTLELAGFKGKVMHTPGHTAGSVCYYYEDPGVLFAGDTLFFRSYGRTDLPTGNDQQMVSSLIRLLSELPEEVTVLCGHGRSTTIGYEKKIKGFA